MAAKHADAHRLQLVQSCYYGGFLVLVIVLTIMNPRISTIATASTTSDHEVRLVSGCTCIGHPLKFECTAAGPGATIWQGSALNCPSSVNKIQLYHSRFVSGREAGSCNSGNIVASGLDTAEGRYRSQLSIQSLTPEMAGATVECLYDNGTHTHSINNITIIITTETFPPPTNISVNTVSKGILQFSWDSVAPVCTAIEYNINADKCGRCPIATTSTSVICAGIEVEDEEMCSFSISTVVCSGSLTGVIGPGAQSRLEVMLRVPGNISSSAIEVIPTYDNNTSCLTKLTTKLNTTLLILLQESNIMQHKVTSNSYDMINSSVASYTVNYTDVNTGKSCGTGTLSPSTCTNGICIHEFLVNSSLCQPETNYSIKIYGTNAVGDGKNSDPIRRDFINHFVRVAVNASKRAITCEFENYGLGSDGMKTCSVTYFDEYCQEKILTITGVTDGIHITLNYGDSLKTLTTYCYIIEASNGTLKVIVSGEYHQQAESDGNDHSRDSRPATGIDDWIIIVSAVIPPMTIIAITIVVTIATIKCHKPERSKMITRIVKKKTK